MSMRFLEYLAEEEAIPASQIESLRQLFAKQPEVIGAIAFSYGLITGGDIDTILDEQKRHYRPFGEIATSMGMLTRDQLTALLEVQKLREATGTAEALALAGVCPVADLFRLLGKFLARKARGGASSSASSSSSSALHHTR